MEKNQKTPVTTSNKSNDTASKDSAGLIKDQVHGVFEKAREKVKQVARSLEEKLDTKN
ncbi:MAG: hypothetical protein ABIR96_03230 [Bdellovibrionota bacterium]